MIWDKKLNAMVLSLLVLSGCALGPERSNTPDNMADATEESEALLKQAFSEAVVLMENGDTEDARDRFEQIAAQHPQRTGPLVNLGVIAFQEGDTELAQLRFNEVLALDPAHPVALNHLGVIARNAGNFPTARQRYSEALAANPEYLPALLNLAFLLDIYLGEPEQALLLYEQYKALAVEPDPRLDDWIFDAKNRI
ncbi:tetratricopeptide repeat protein [Marinobacter sp. 1_MG-2023]|uniref:tetratricopeptide repeat protein n=1 Tax=Marinobacter sp. 1_MG-2023 TaxID=3062627 RepID=UPI0026E29145|nr:tetratricopeptide repeat protein [Marinobacter sp. 1_MG-2023]MDO6823451.1 tetratricopeptide repeat protein [Marinobacter sp. 1_MG-2023]